jgi:hypothetical protein
MIHYLLSKHKYKQEVGMNDEPQKTQVTSDDQDLAKALAGIKSDDNTPVDLEGSLKDEMTKSSGITPQQPSPAPAMAQAPSTLPTPSTPTAQPTPAAMPSGDLESIKKNALNELRPLVDKLSLEPEEMFDTYLLLIRSTDDKALISPAHDAAQKITDETKKAQALLEIVKEIDYLSNLNQ